MTGAEIVAAGKAIEAVGSKALGQDEKVTEALLQAAEKTPEMAAAARSMAARVAVKERVKLKLYQPFARMLGVSKAYFEDTFPEEMAAKTADIPDENLITPPASIAVPTLQGLSYTFEEPNLKEMYLNLLTTASDDRRADTAHPAFAEIIKQLSARETKFLHDVLKSRSVVAAQVKNLVEPGGFVVVLTHLLPWIDSDTQVATEVAQMPTWVDNWERLGLVRATYTEFRAGEGAYDWVASRPEYLRTAKQSGIIELTFDKGLVEATDFGKQFLRAVS
ncbi:DUF4393 domain-containing protein [Lentzea sp. JNUCC 0626]|uniref:DUF4393 domain-containing protein n=1 Tax=Lentzea sp. JNUCC 0626 TaxID=3367513 RepID=UPI003748EC24